MADYSKTTNFTAKDSLPTGNPSKTILGSEHDTEYSNIQTAIATKANKTGAPATTNNLAMLSATGDLADSLIETDGSGNISSNGSATFSALTLGGTLITSSAAELNYNAGVTLGTVQASKTVTADASGYITFDTSSANKYIKFSDISGSLHDTWIYGDTTTGNVGIYDNTNGRFVYTYSPAGNTITFTPPIVASGGITGNVTSTGTNSMTTLNATTVNASTTLTKNSVPVYGLVVLDTPEQLATGLTEGAWTSSSGFASTTLSAAGAVKAIIRVYLSESSIGTTVEINASIRKAGTSLSASQTIIASDYGEDHTDSSPNARAVGETTVNLDGSSDFEYYVSTTGNGFNTSVIYLVGYYV